MALSDTGAVAKLLTYRFLLLLLFIISSLSIIIEVSNQSSSGITVADASADITILAGSYGTTNDVLYFPIVTQAPIHVLSAPTINDDPTIYVSDLQFCVVRRIVKGSSVVVAGNGICAVIDPQVTSGIATKFSLSAPGGVYLDVSTNILYILDINSSSGSIIRTVDLTSGMLNTLILTYEPSIYNMLSSPVMITKNGQTFYIVDSGNNFIRSLTLTGTNTAHCKVIVGGINDASTGCTNVDPLSCQLSSPTSVTFSSDGMIITDRQTSRMLAVLNNLIYPYTNLLLPSVLQIYSLGSGNYLASNGILLESLSQTSKYSTNSKDLLADKNWPVGYFGYDATMLNAYFLCEQPNLAVQQIVQFYTQGQGYPTIVAGKYPYVVNNKIPAFNLYFDNLNQIEYVSDREIYFTTYNSAIMKFDMTSGLATMISGSFDPDNSNFKEPRALAKISNGLLVADTSNRLVWLVDNSGQSKIYVGSRTSGVGCSQGVQATQCGLGKPSGVVKAPSALSAQFLFVIADSQANSLIQVSQNQMIFSVNSNPMLSKPQGLFYSQSGTLYIANSGSNQILTLTPDGMMSVIAGTGQPGSGGDGGMATQAQLQYPTAVTVTSNNQVYIADTGNNCIRRIDSNGVISTVTRNAIQGTNGVAVTATGDLLYSDSFTLRKVTSSNCLNSLGQICSNHGSCVNGACQCDSGWRGDSMCGQFSCDIPKPTNALKCIGPNQYSCIDGWFGPSCDLPICFGIPYNSSFVCNSHGTCISRDTCQCNSGWNGNNQCGQFSCDIPKPENANQCIGPNQYSCIAGWFGDLCNLPICFGIQYNNSLVCNSHGTCVSSNTCQCESGWHGNDQCGQFSCDFEKPPNADKCIGPNEYSCIDGWFGATCSFPICFGVQYNNSAVCSSHGKCISSNTCQCDSGWRGNSMCGQFSCDFPKPENANQCIGPNQYSCMNGWFGDSCNFPICFGIRFNNSLVCSSHGKCISSNTCDCDSGWHGNDQCGQFSCDIPSQHGICIGPNTYKCQSGWTGDICDIAECFGKLGNDSLVCSSHGKCIGNNTCQCDSGWHGNNQCGQFSCDIPKPTNALKCIGPNQYSCMDGWFGPLCDLPICFGIPYNSSFVCNSHGTCISRDTCQCESGWKGRMDCSQYSCDGVAECSHNGQCISNNTCKCISGWSSSNCDIFNCNRVQNCNSHGQCISNNTCQCESGWGGQTCLEYNCDGVNNCHYNGLCVSNNTCKCNAEFGGNDCSIPFCYGQLGNNGCENSGICISFNKCSCIPIYFGDQCSWLDCDPNSNDISLNSTKRCSGNGQCINIRNNLNQNSTSCKCNDGFSGKFCQTRGNSNNSQVVAIIVSILIVIIILIILSTIIGTYIYVKKFRNNHQQQQQHYPDEKESFLSLNTVRSNYSENNPSLNSITTASDYNNGSSSSIISSKTHFKIRDKEYVMEKKLGSGSNGSVFVFKELTSRELLAVKQIEITNPFGNEFKEVVNMFELSEESNIHIVPIIGCTMVENGGFICILMPLYKCDLRDWVYANQKSIPLDLIIEIVRQTALGLQYLHSKNMIHRDLKQTNIFIAKSNEKDFKSDDFLLCIGDWGSSRSNSRSNLTVYEGTIQFSSPEAIIRGEVDQSSDIWSLGCIFYQLLSGDYESILFRIKHEGKDQVIDNEILLPKIEQFGKKMNYLKHSKFQHCFELLCEMLRYDPSKRITAEQILQRIKEFK